MSMLDRVKNICGAETALGIPFCSPEAARSYLPQRSSIFAAAGDNLLCHRPPAGDGPQGGPDPGAGRRPRGGAGDP